MRLKGETRGCEHDDDHDVDDDDDDDVGSHKHVDEVALGENAWRRAVTLGTI